jgi:hypothetical protein
MMTGAQEKRGQVFSQARKGVGGLLSLSDTPIRGFNSEMHYTLGSATRQSPCALHPGLSSDAHFGA